MAEQELGATAEAAAQSDTSVLPSVAEMDAEIGTEHAIGEGTDQATDAASAASSPAHAQAEPGEETDASEPAAEPSSSDLLAEVRKLIAPAAAPATPAAPAAAPKPADAPAAAPAAAAAPAFDAEAVLKHSSEFVGEDFTNNVMKPVMDRLAAMEKENAELRGKVAPAAEFTAREQAVQNARQIESVHKTFDGFATKGFKDRYGASAAEAFANPTQRAAREQVFKDAAGLQELAKQKGQVLDNAKALRMAHELAVQGETKSEAAAKVTSELRQRSRGRSAGPSPAPSRGVASVGAGADDEAIATASKFFG